MNKTRMTAECHKIIEQIGMQTHEKKKKLAKINLKHLDVTTNT